MIPSMHKKRWRVTMAAVCQLLVLHAALVQQVRAQQRGLKIVVVEGEGFRNVVQQIAPRPLSVRVTDAGNRPIAGATVVFTAPQTGPSGEFENDARTIRIASGPDGMATARAYHPNGITGPYQIGVSAEFQGETANGVITQINIAEKRGHGKLLATIAIAAAAGGAAYAFRNKNTATPATPTGPTITFGGSAVGAPKQ